jgi:hypothetical protein
MEKMVKEFPQPFAEFINAQAHIKFSGPEFVRFVREEIEKKHGKPEKGKAAGWFAEHKAQAEELAKERAKTFVHDVNESLLSWAKEWKEGGTKTTKKIPVKGFSKLLAALNRVDLTPEQAGKVAAALAQIGAKDKEDLEARFVEAVELELDV